MRIVTFAGNLTYIDEIIKKNKVTDIYIDKSFNYGRNSIPPNAKIVDTGIPSSFTETENRRIRIGKMLLFILNDINDDIFFVDSDVIIENVDNLLQILQKTQNVTPLCIPALLKPFNILGEFCYPTTFYMPKDKHDTVVNVIREYLANKRYITDPIDIYLHSRIGSKPTRYPSVCHYIRGEKICLT